jgi:hypothetical protein
MNIVVKACRCSNPHTYVCEEHLLKHVMQMTPLAHFVYDFWKRRLPYFMYLWQPSTDIVSLPLPVTPKAVPPLEA